MAYRVAWSPEALEDLEAIAEFIGRDSRFYAQAVVAKVLATGANVADFPEAGRIVPKLDDKAIREHFSLQLPDDLSHRAGTCARYCGDSWQTFA